MKSFLRVSGWLLVLVLLTCTAITLTHSPKVAAATPTTTEGFNVVTSPLPIKISTPPGKTVTQELRIKNEGDQPEGIKVGLLKFGASGSTGQPDLYNLTSKDTYSSWVHFSPQEFTAQPNIWVSVTMTINVPADADLGYYLAVTFSPANRPDARDVTNLNGSAATLVLLNVQSGNEKRSLQLSSFSVTHKLYEYLPVDFNVKIHNNGNIYDSPVGNIFIQKGGKTIDTIDFNEPGGSVLPSSNRVFTESWSNGFPLYVDRLVNGKPVPDKHDIPKRSLHWDFTQANKLRFGKYDAKLLIAYDNGTEDVPLEATVSFWVLPWKLMLLVLVIIAVIGLGLFMAVRSAVRKARHGVGKRHASKK